MKVQYTGGINFLAESDSPITINTVKNIGNTSSLDLVDNFVKFLGSLLFKIFEDKNLKLEVMNDIMQN